jgi:hypothetical protein
MQDSEPVARMPGRGPYRSLKDRASRVVSAEEDQA